MVDKILLANPRGYCAGVTRAIDVVELALEKFGKPIYVKHHIVHNDHVVRDLEKKGAIFVEELSEIPQGAKVVFSAHGTSPAVKEEAKERGLDVIDAVCPLVTKVHVEARRYHRNGYTIIIIGHKGHIEMAGTMGCAPMNLVETREDVQNLDIKPSEKMVYLTQTTLSIDDTKEVIAALKEKYPIITAPPKEDICYATTNRQGAVKELAKQTQLILVVGSQTSSNSKRLVDTAKNYGINSYLINDTSYIDDQWFENVETLGLTSGASVPDNLVQEVITYIQNKFPNCNMQPLNYIEENVEFIMPDGL